MESITSRSIASEVKAATGYNEVAWRYFMKITRRFAEDMMGVSNDSSADGISVEIQNDIAGLAHDIRRQCGGAALTSWDEVSPPEENYAVERVNSILTRADMTPVSRQVMRWRMLLAFRYLRRDVRRGEISRLGAEAATAADPPTPTTSSADEHPYRLPPIRDDRLPPIRDILREDFARREED